METVSKSKLITSALLLGAALTLGCFSQITQAAEPEESAQTVIPSTVAGIWSSIDKEQAVLAQVIQAGKMDVVHEHAFAIRDLVRALPEHYQELTTEQKQKLKEDVRFIDILATRLDQTGDAKDKAGTQSNFRKLEAVLKSIRNQYRIVK